MQIGKSRFSSCGKEIIDWADKPDLQKEEHREPPKKRNPEETTQVIAGFAGTQTHCNRPPLT